MRLWLLIGSFFGLLLLITVVNAKINGGFKIETSWIAIALSPTLIWLLSSGQMAELSGFGVAFKLREAIARPFSLNHEGSKIQPEKLPADAKTGIAAIPRFIDKRIPAMLLEVGRKGYYYGPAIMEYLDRLVPHDFFRYLIFIDANGRFIAFVPARTIYEQLLDDNIDIVQIIESGNLTALNGIISTSVRNDANKQSVLEIMAKQRLSELPVVDENNVFIGVIDRDKLTSSIVLDLVAQKS
jgi:CBS domain-containing protein